MLSYLHAFLQFLTHRLTDSQTHRLTAIEPTPLLPKDITFYEYMLVIIEGMSRIKTHAVP